MRRPFCWRLVASVPFAVGCSGDESETSGGVPGCAPGEWLRGDGICVAAGLGPDMLCPPGEWYRETDAACIPAGVPPDGCGEGFVHDGDRGCEPILPATPCPEGLMAVPGETSCREVALCETGAWGGVPVEPSTEYVDATYSGGMSDGSQAAPWTTVQAGVDAALAGAIVAIAAGSYVEDVVVAGKPVRLWGRCPGLVELAGTGNELAALFVRVGASGSEVRRLEISGQATGVVVSGSEDVLLDQVWIHDNARRGASVENALGPTSVVVGRSLIEQSHEFGMFVLGASATLDATVMRDSLPDLQGAFGRGISAQDDAATGARASLTVSRSVLERSHQVGAFVGGSDASVDATVVRDTLPDAQGLFGLGISVEANPPTGARAIVAIARSLVEASLAVGVLANGSDATVDATVVRNTAPNAQGSLGVAMGAQIDSLTGKRSSVTVARSLLEESQEVGLLVSGSDATIEATAVRDTLPNAQGNLGRGIGVQDDLALSARATVTVARSLVERSHDHGVFVGGSDATVEATLVRDTMPDALGLGGRGIGAQHNPTTGARARVSVVRSLLERSHEVGVLVLGSEATIEATVVRDTLPNGVGYFGRGVQVQSDQETGAAASATLLASVIERSVEAGIAVVGSATADVDGCLVQDAAPRNGLLGDGLVVWSFEGPASATVSATRIERSARAAVSSFGATVAIGGALLVCQSFDIGAESWAGQATVLDDRGGVLCGCPEATAQCQAQSYALEPPAPID